jgi:hypothetical protein
MTEKLKRRTTRTEIIEEFDTEEPLSKEEKKPGGGRWCQLEECGADISHRHPTAKFCCKQHRYKVQ